MLSKHKWPTFEGIAVIILLIISIFGFAFFTADDNKITGMTSIEGLSQITGAFVSRFSGEDGIPALNKVTGMAGMERVAGMDVGQKETRKVTRRMSNLTGAIMITFIYQMI